ncbi:MAG TPA: MBL fold metallo-hydrolase [Anaeromyxobacter sp.]|nr:MBL fold metallo-hydrolase [Anaeromyxobacter sp.]
MSFVALGVGDAFSAIHYSSGLAVEADGRWLLVDCPHPIRKVLREASGQSGVALDVGSFEAVVITHLHADHCAGLEDLAYFSRFSLGRRPRLVAHPAVLSRVWEGRLAAGMESLSDPVGWTSRPMRLEDYFEVTPLDDGRRVEVGAFAIACRPTRHHVFTTALRIRAGGRELGISSDTDHDPALVEWLSRADLFLHETGAGIHTPYAALAALPAEVRARMRLIHYPDGFEPSDGAVELIEEGRRYAV